MMQLRVVLAAMALIAGVLAGVAGTPAPALGAAEISALELAQRIVNRKSKLQLLDLRSQTEFELDRLPGAVLWSGLDGSVADAVATLVVYDSDSVAPDTFRQILARLARREALPRIQGQALQVLRLHGGLRAWSKEVLFPQIRSDARPAQRDEFESIARLSRYFGGSPRVLAPGAAAASQKRSRRGC